VLVARSTCAGGWNAGVVLCPSSANVPLLVTRSSCSVECRRAMLPTGGDNVGVVLGLSSANTTRLAGSKPFPRRGIFKAPDRIDPSPACHPVIGARDAAHDSAQATPAISWDVVTPEEGAPFSRLHFTVILKMRWGMRWGDKSVSAGKSKSLMLP
jgi:hypothetical protein